MTQMESKITHEMENFSLKGIGFTLEETRKTHVCTRNALLLN